MVDSLSILQISDVFKTVVDYITPKDLLNLTRSCKALYNNPLLTLSTVINVSLMNGNKNTKVAIERIYHQILSKRIHVPTERRLLYLVTTERCEFCHINKVNLISPYGLAFCIQCKRRHTKEIVLKPEKMLNLPIEINDIIELPSVFSILHHFKNDFPFQRVPVFYVLEKPCYDHNKNRIGSIITRKHLNEMLELQDLNKVENYIKKHHPNQSKPRSDFILAMKQIREQSFAKNQQREANLILSRKMFRIKKYNNIVDALSFLRGMIPVRYHWRLAFVCLSRRCLNGTHNLSVHERILQGPRDANIIVHVIDPEVRNIVKPLLGAPSRFNDETNTKHQAKLHDLACLLCKLFGARGEDEYPATW